MSKIFINGAEVLLVFNKWDLVVKSYQKHRYVASLYKSHFNIIDIYMDLKMHIFPKAPDVIFDGY